MSRARIIIPSWSRALGSEWCFGPGPRMDGSCMDSCWDGLEIILRASVPRDRGLIITFKTWPANYKEKSELQITLNDLMCYLFITKTSWLSQITLIEWQKPICTTPLCQHLLDPCWHGDRYIIHDHTGTALSLYNLGFTDSFKLLWLRQLRRLFGSNSSYYVRHQKSLNHLSKSTFM